MKIERRWLTFTACSLIAIVGSQVYAQSPPRKHVPVETSVVLSTLAEDASISHRLVNHDYEIEILYKKSMLGTKKLDLKVESMEPGRWSESIVTSGSTLEVKRTGKNEPRGCVVQSIYTMEKDPAAAYETEVINRLRGQNIAVDPVRASNEVKRLVDQYGHTLQHVLKLPRSASSRLNPEDTLRRLCRWIAYDKMFKRLLLDTRPVATETDAKKTYDQVLALLRGNPLPEDESEHLISAEELDRIREAYQFTYTVKFVPHLMPDEPDRNWRSARRVSFTDGHVGRVLWRGQLGQGHQSTAWLVFRTKPSDSDLAITNAKKAADLKWTVVDGPEGWRYLRLLNVSKKAPAPFDLKIIGDENAPEIQFSHSDSQGLQFPF